MIRRIVERIVEITAGFKEMRELQRERWLV
jgi:hypothetical protein